MNGRILEREEKEAEDFNTYLVPTQPATKTRSRRKWDVTFIVKGLGNGRSRVKLWRLLFEHVLNRPSYFSPTVIRVTEP